MSNTLLTVTGIAFIFLMTALGSAVVFFFKGEIPARLNAFFFGIAAGVMIAASVWSLLLPALSQASVRWGRISFLPVGFGILLGGTFLVALDLLASKCKGNSFAETNEKQKVFRLFLAVTLHNIPEALAVGFAFGTASAIGTTSAFVGALGLAIGIGVQNFPEGAAISLPMKSVVKSNKKAFSWGAGSGLCEPVFAVIGYFLSAQLITWQPWLLAFSAGAMLFVSAEDLIPDSKTETAAGLGTWGVMFGFVLMMALDTALG